MQHLSYIIEMTCYQSGRPCPTSGYLISPSMDRFSNFCPYRECAFHFSSFSDAWRCLSSLEHSYPSCVFDVVTVCS